MLPYGDKFYSPLPQVVNQSGKVTDIYQLPVEKDGINYYPVRIVLDTEEYPLRFGSGCEVKIVTGHDKILWVMLGLRGERFRGTE